LENILKILELGNDKEKIKILETLDDTNNSEILEQIISKLDDKNIQVRGEAFSSLVINKNQILNFLIKSLNSSNENIRGFTLLVLANRNETNTIPEIIKLVKDKHSMVRSCAIGALGHLKAQEIKEIYPEVLLDSNIEVKKSMLQAIIDQQIIISKNILKKIIKEKDPEVQKLISKLKI